MGSRRDAVVLAALVLSLVALALLVRPRVQDRSEVLHLSSHRTGPNGVRALYLLIEELSIRANRRTEPWAAAIPPGAIVLLAPALEPTPREVRAIITWMENGGTLIYGLNVDGADPVGGALGLVRKSLAPDTLGPLETLQWEGVPSFPGVHRWTNGVDSVPGFAVAFADSSRALSGSGVEVLLRAPDGSPTLVAIPRGMGRLVAWSDPTVLVNRALRAGDAGLIFVRAGEEAVRQGGSISFDEYHQGYSTYGGPFAVVRRFATETGAGRSLLQAAGAALLLLLLAAHRLGEPIEERVHWRRSPLEHVDALAAAYQRAGARITARRLLLAGVERRLGRRIGGLEGAPSATNAHLIAGDRLTVEWRRAALGDLASLANTLDDYEAEIRK